jgi:hypothetical protein
MDHRVTEKLLRFFIARKHMLDVGIGDIRRLAHHLAELSRQLERAALVRLNADRFDNKRGPAQRRPRKPDHDAGL